VGELGRPQPRTTEIARVRKLRLCRAAFPCQRRHVAVEQGPVEQERGLRAPQNRNRAVDRHVRRDERIQERVRVAWISGGMCARGALRLSRVHVFTETLAFSGDGSASAPAEDLALLGVPLRNAAPWIARYGTRVPGSPVSCAVGGRPRSSAHRTSAAWTLVHLRCSCSRAALALLRGAQRAAASN
jgi:hypothetical protein